MDIALNLRHQNGADWGELLTAVKEAESYGFSTVFLPDHYVAIEHVTRADGTRSTADIDSPTGPSDAWTLIAALVTHTTTLRFGTMMTSSTFRLPGPLAVLVAQLNAISGGRIELGIGTNWHEPEHLSFGIPYPAPSVRFARLEEQLSVIRALWSRSPDERFDLVGEHFQLRGARGIPRPEGVPVPPVVLGGSGLVRTPRLIAAFADEANSPAASSDAARTFFQACADACEAAGRDPASLRRSRMLSVCCGADDADVERHLAAAGLARDQIDPSIVCTPAELLSRVERCRADGVDRVVLSRRGGVDLPSLRLIGREVLTALAVA